MIGLGDFVHALADAARHRLLAPPRQQLDFEARHPQGRTARALRMSDARHLP